MTRSIRVRFTALGLVGAAAIALSGCELGGGGDNTSPSPTPDATVSPASAPDTSVPADGDDPDAEQGDDARIEAGTAVLMVGDDVYTASGVTCTGGDDGFTFETTSVAGPYDGELLLFASFGIADEADRFGIMFDFLAGPIPSWVVQEEDASGREVGEFTTLDVDAPAGYVKGEATYEAVVEHNMPMNPDGGATLETGSFEAHCA